MGSNQCLPRWRRLPRPIRRADRQRCLGVAERGPAAVVIVGFSRSSLRGAVGVGAVGAGVGPFVVFAAMRGAATLGP
jgi:hypothetical protein